MYVGASADERCESTHVVYGQCMYVAGHKGLHQSLIGGAQNAWTTPGVIDWDTDRQCTARHRQFGRCELPAGHGGQMHEARPGFGPSAPAYIWPVNA